ncbi:MAG: hypothetical protein U0587_04185 [Candidatus Binatia bacterium]
MTEPTVSLVFTLPTINLILMAVHAAAHVSPEGPAKERFRRVADEIVRELKAAGAGESVAREREGGPRHGH